MDLPLAPVAGRYRLLAPIGQGSTGTVYRGEDVGTGAPVAVKLLTDATPRRLGRFEREARALQILGVPGVVRLLAEGEHEGRRYLVTDFVEGAPFPGRAAPVAWPALAPTALRLFETLAAIHAAGVLHRDLKPANVLVDASGAPTVLDFGLSRYDGAASLTLTGDVLGTPRYQAPEQILGDHPVDARADLYAVGVMLYEALAGALPRPRRSVGRVYAARLVHDAPPLAGVAPEVPAAVAALVDQLVARAPEDRPPSARAVLAALADSTPTRAAGEIPWLGPSLRAPIRAALEAGRSVAVVGPRGSGRTRLLREVEAELAGAGVPSVRLLPGERPLESLGAALGAPLAGEAEAAAALAARGGAVALVDGEADPWSLGVLAAAGRPRVTTRLADGAAPVDAAPVDPAPVDELHLAPLAATDLAPLFAVGEREARAAAELLRARTAGLPARVAAEVGRWTVEGHARWTGDRLRLAPETRWVLALGPPPDVRPGRRGQLPLPPPLEQALAWIALAEPWATVPALAVARNRPAWEIEAEARALAERGAVRRAQDGSLHVRADLAAAGTWFAGERAGAYRALADAAPEASPARLARLFAAGAWPEAADTAEALARAALAAGEAGTAWGAAVWGVRAALEGDRPVAGVATALARAALGLGTPGALRAAADILAQAAAHLPEPELAELRALLDAAARPGPLDVPAPADAALAAACAELRFERRLAVDPTGAAAELDATDGLPRARRLVREARLRLAAGRAEEAVALLERAGREDVPPLDAPGLRVWLAEALLEGGALTEAGREARGVLEDATTRGHLRHAGHAAAVARDAAVRAGGGGGPSAAAVADAEALGIPWLTARVCLTEAAAAWRASAYEEAARLARRAVAADPGGGAVPVLARALELACESDALPPACDALLDAADRLGDPAVALQVRGLVALAHPAGAGALLADAEALAARAGRLGEPRAVLSGAEAVAFCRVRARRGPR